MNKTAIGWTDRSWNPVIGCQRVSSGCDSCYAESFASDRLAANANYRQVLRFAPDGKARGWNGKALCLPERLNEPKGVKEPSMFFVNSMADWLHKDVPLEFIQRMFDVMNETPRHIYQPLTKRPERLAEIEGKVNWTPNIWNGVSCENQETADLRIPLLLASSAAVKWVSAEPLLGGIDLQPDDPDYDCGGMYLYSTNMLNWVVCGAESLGFKAGRECKNEWIQYIVKRCKLAGVPVFVKQIQIGGRICKDMSQFPPELQVQEWPERVEA